MADLATPITLFTAAQAAQLADPPAAWADVALWRGRSPAAFDIEIWKACTLTALKICGAVPKSEVIADDGVDGVTAGADTLTITGHALRTGDGPIQFTTAGTLPGGIQLLTNYWVGVVDANTIKLFTSRAALLAGGSVAASTAVDILDAGSGAHTLVDTPDTERLYWMNYGLLGPLGDGAVTTTAAMGYNQRVTHRHRTVAYALIGTLGSGNPNATLQFSVV